jgi:2-dehydro-3-deoxy-D-gluconate 5-dehydrogenase
MVLDDFALKGKAAIVTGSSTGLGQGMSLALAQAGASVLGVDYVESADTEKTIESSGGKFEYIVRNLMTIEHAQGIVDEAVKRFGRLDILVNNAGIIRRQDIIDFTEKDWDDVLAINLKTVFFLSQAAARRFIGQGGGGKILNVASMLSFQGGIRVVSYTASKSGVAGITRAMANEWAKHGINVNAIAPGYMATNNTAPLRADAERSEDILKRIPAGRWGTPADVAGPAVFLCSPAADYVNGYTLAVDGGWLAR